MKILLILLSIMTLVNGVAIKNYGPSPACLELIPASKEGNIDAVTTLLANGCNPNIFDVRRVNNIADNIFDFDWTPLIEASFNGHRDVVQTLLSQPNIDVEKKSDSGYTALHAAAFNGYTDIAKDLLAEGANVKSRSNHFTFSWTPLMVASYAGGSGMVELLIQQPNTEMETKDSFGDTALIISAGRGHAGVVEALLAAGAHLPDSLAPDSSLETIMMTFAPAEVDVF